MSTQIKMPRQGQSVESCIITKLYVEEGKEVNKGDLLFAYETDKASFEYESEQDGILLKWIFSEGDEVPVLETVCIVGEEGEALNDGSEFQPNGVSSTKRDVVDSKSTTIEVSQIHASKRHESGTEQRELAVASEGCELDETLRHGSGDPRQQGESDPRQRGDIPLSRHKVGTSPLKGGSKISPRARKMAEEKGIDPSALKGSGPGGRIIVRDLEGAEKTEPALTSHADPGEYSEEPLTNIRKLIAKSMYQSLQNSAQLTHHLGADARKLLAARERIKRAEGTESYVNITINDLVCFAVIEVLKKHPRVNSQLYGETMKLFRHVNMGIAVDTERGLMVPVIKEADRLSIEEFSKRAAALSDKCRSGSIDPDILRPEAGSFTVSNLGNYGVEMFTPVINLPQTAILGVNTIVIRPADLGNRVFGFVPYIGLSLTYDHRALDGGEATRFLKQVAVEIENIEIK